MTTIAFLGLGQMGAPIAANLVAARFDLTVWNRSAERTAEIASAGAAVASSPAEAAAEAEVVITMVTDPAALDQVVFGEHGIAETIRPGAAFIDLSTVGPAAIRDVAARLPDGVDVLDAPVRGSVHKARAGTLGVLVGGDADAFDRWRDVLAAIGDPVYVGALGAGQIAKIVNNVAVITSMALVGESVALAERLGAETGAALDLLEQTYIGDAVRYVRARMEPGDFAPRFKAELAAKDLRLALDAEGGPELRTVAAAASWYDDVMALGLGGLDFTVVAAVARGERPTPSAAPEVASPDPAS